MRGNSPNWNLPFHTHIDASDKSLGVVLKHKDTAETYVNYYISKNIVSAELDYIVTEKEFLLVVYAINNFHH